MTSPASGTLLGDLYMRAFTISIILVTLLAACSRPSERPGAGSPVSRASAPLEATSSTRPANEGITGPLRVGGEVSAPIVISRVEFTYQSCVGQKVWGFPILEAVIDETGRVQNLRLLKPVHPCLEAAILPAVRQWRFKPATLHGKPVPVIYNMTVSIHYR